MAILQHLYATCRKKRPRVFIINLDFSVLDVRLKFELFRVCGDGESLSLGVWEFTRTNTTLRTAVDKAFTFIFCENSPCLGYCEYFVTVTPIEITEGLVTATISNGRIAALAIEE